MRIARQLLVNQNLPDDIEGLLAPILDLAEDPEMSAAGRDRVVFRSPDVFRWFDLPGPVPLRTVVGRYCHVLPLLNQLCADREFYILGLSEKNLRLLLYTDGECEELQLPDAVPESAQAAGAFDAPDHMLRDRSAARRSRGSGSPAVVFGTGSEREKAHERLQEFFRLADQELAKVLRGQLLMLSGVGYEVAIYRRAAIYPHLMEGYLEGDLHELTTQEIARRAHAQARVQERRKAEEQLQQLREMTRTERISSGIHRVLKAAEEGRVAKLVLGEEAQFGATSVELEPDSQENLLNAAAVLSIRDGAQIFLLPAKAMGPLAPVAALLLY